MLAGGGASLRLSWLKGRSFRVRPLGRLEKGDPRVSFGSYATVLFVLGLTDSLRNLVDANNDPVGRTLEEERLPKRIHRPKSYE